MFIQILTYYIDIHICQFLKTFRRIKKITKHILKEYLIFIFLKGNENIISSNPPIPCKDDNARLTTVHLKALSKLVVNMFIIQKTDYF